MDSKITMIIKNNELYKLSWAVLPDKYIDEVKDNAEEYAEKYGDVNDNDVFDLMIDAIWGYLHDEHRSEFDDFCDFDEKVTQTFDQIYAGVELDDAEYKAFGD